MPKNNQPKRGGKRNLSNNKKNNKRGSRGNKTKSNLALPDFQIVTLKYEELLARAPGTSFDEYVYSANGGFDPNVTGTGGQPLLWDQYSSQYLRYYISHSRIVLKCINTNNTSGIYLNVFPTGSSAGASLFVDAAAQDYAHNGFAGINSSMCKLTLRNNISMDRIFGRPTLCEGDFQAGVSAQPGRQVYWVINAYAADLSSNVSYDLEVKIYYRVRFMQRFAQDLSSTALLKTRVDNYNAWILSQKMKSDGPLYLKDKNLTRIKSRDYNNLQLIKWVDHDLDDSKEELVLVSKQ